MPRCGCEVPGCLPGTCPNPCEPAPLKLSTAHATALAQFIHKSAAAREASWDESSEEYMVTLWDACVHAAAGSYATPFIGVVHAMLLHNWNETLEWAAAHKGGPDKPAADVCSRCGEDVCTHIGPYYGLCEHCESKEEY